MLKHDNIAALRIVFWALGGAVRKIRKNVRNSEHGMI